jgi:hypothetical protein
MNFCFANLLNRHTVLYACTIFIDMTDCRMQYLNAPLEQLPEMRENAFALYCMHCLPR